MQDVFTFSIFGYDIEWNYQHTVNIYQDGVNIDVFSLDYGRDYDAIEVVAAAMEWVGGYSVFPTPEVTND